jgi:endonuclease/exonuclease/phosphatase family metal-dependent hydrolase
MRLFLLLLLALSASAESLRVLSFNVRYANPQDGANIWENRRDLFLRTVREANPDLMGTQELLKSQGDDIARAMPELTWFGVGRRGDATDEHMGVFYRKDRLELLSSGNFWLSETPEIPGSSHWNMSLPRMVTWGRFKTRAGVEFLFLNTHFPHRGNDEPARQMNARVIASRIALHDPALPILVTGDFNAPAGGPTWKLLVPPMKDAWLEAPKKSGPEGTFHGFTGKPGAARIDWILFRAPWRVLETHALTAHDGPLYPSDHFPVLAVFDLP